jgi:lysyl-tRNA synthetase class 2
MIDGHGLRRRAYVLAALRRWFATHGYLEVPTPALVPSPALEEHLFAIPAADAWLRTSPEFALKRVLAAGLERIYEIGPCWRDREYGPWHGREFWMIEWYRVGASLDDLMREVEALVEAACGVAARTPPTWRRRTVRELFREHAGMDPSTATVLELSGGVEETWDDAFARRWVMDVEPRLQGAVFVTDWPASQAALARTGVDADGWPIAHRFEAFFDGVELANAFWELTDPVELRRRFATANAIRASLGEAPHPVDEALIAAVGEMADTSGIAMGLDRLVAAVSSWPGIAPGRVPDPPTTNA